MELVGVTDGVMLRFRQTPGSRFELLNSARGTLVKVRLTWGTVDFGTLGIWNVELDNLLPAAESDNQGMMLTLGGVE